MGYEYGFVFSLSLQTPQLEDLVQYLKTVHPWLPLLAAPGDTSDVVR